MLVEEEVQNKSLHQHLLTNRFVLLQLVHAVPVLRTQRMRRAPAYSGRKRSMGANPDEVDLERIRLKSLVNDPACTS